MKKTLLLFCSLAIVTLMQALTITNNTPGNLATAVGAELTTCTSLTVTGNIDARDFKTMKESMTSLTSIDLSNANIVEYTGTEGIYSSNFTYKANSVPGESFSSKTNLTTILIPNSTTTIGSWAFYNCGISSIILPDLIQNIEYCTFSNCRNLTTITLPKSLKSIGNDAFSQCLELETITIPNTVTSIGNDAFYSCNKITAISLSNQLVSIGNNAFTSCMSLTSITFPSSLKTIGNNAFIKCRGLTSLLIPSTIISIGSNAFSLCTGLTSITAENIIPLDLSLSTTVFNGVNKSTCTLYVPKNTVAAYDAAVQWTDFVNIVDYTVTDINATKLQVNISIAADRLVVSDVAIGQSIMVYNLNGAMLYNQKATNSSEEIELPQHGVYIVKVGEKSEKVVY